jgi:oxalate decarboxylase/phosphoglucose isomerase-like protein (cupin superfamily)
MVEAAGTGRRAKYLYEKYIEGIGVPIHTGHFIPDLRTAEVGWWEERQTNTAFLQLKGMEGVSEGRLTEIAPGGSVPAVKFGFGETVYVVQGQGFATVWAGDGPKKTFEWQAHSVFHIPRYSHYELSNARGDQPARLLHYNYLPMALTVVPDLNFFFNSQQEDPELLYGRDDDVYSAARAVLGAGARDTNAEEWGAVRNDNEPAAAHGGVYWEGNFFPDLATWDRLSPWESRGAGGTNVQMRFPESGMTASMSVFDEGLYKKAHLHGPGRVIVIPGGVGYSLLWAPDGEKVVCPWTEGAVFTPPGGWYHQHFNTGDGLARYLKFGHLPQLSGAGEYRHQIEYPEEDMWVREKFESELATVGKKSLMPAEAYDNPDFVWGYGDDN